MSSVASTMFGLWVFVIAALQVTWTTAHKGGVSVVASERQQEVMDCLEASLQARLRFEMRLCHRRSLWLDGCGKTRVETHTAEFDEVTESYRVVSDRQDDELEATAVGIPLRSEAVRVMTTVHEMPLAFIAGDDGEALDHDEAYMQVRSVFVCRGSVNRTIARLSRIITLGLVNTMEDRSSWSDFDITKSTTHR